MLKTKRLGNTEVEKLPEDKNEVVRSTIFPKPHNVILMNAPPDSGKTTCLYTITKNILKCYPLQRKIVEEIEDAESVYILGEEKRDPNKPEYERKVTFIIFSSTAFTDPKMIYIMELISKAKAKFAVHKSTIDEDGVNILQHILNEITEKKENEDEMEFADSDSEEEELDKKVRKLTTPITHSGDYVFIFDDMQNEYKSNKAILTLLSNLRHMNISNVLMTAQNAKKYHPDMINNSTGALLFNGITDNRLRHIHDNLDIKMPYKEFKKLYEITTKTPPNFLYIDRKNKTFWKNFTDKYEI